MKSWFLQKNDSEKKIIVLLAAFSLLMLLYAFLFLPLKRSNAQLQSSINDIGSDITEMQKMLPEIAQFSNRSTESTPIESAELMMLIEQAAEQQQIIVGDMKPQGENKVSVVLDQVSFNAAIRWFDLLNSQYHIKIANLSVTAEKQGLVNITVTLST